MEYTRITSVSKRRYYLMLLIKIVIAVIIICGTVAILNKIDFPSPNKKIEKTIPNKELKIVK